MALMGVIPPPPGVTANFVNPEQKGKEIYTLGILGIISSTLFLLMRIYTKVRINRSFKSEDVCVVLAWFCSVATVLLVLVSYQQNGEGRHIWNVTIAQFAEYQKFVVASAVIYVACLGLAKTSILLIFRRISSEKRMHLAIYIVGVAVFVYSVVTACLLVFPCRPFARAWDATITTGSCINRPAVYVATAVCNIVTDVFILIIPIPMVIKLKIPLPQKFGLACMFAVGSLTFITSVIRLVTLKPLFTTIDQTWAVATPAIWIVVEANLVIICCCFLALKSFLRHHAPTLIGEKSGEGGYKVNSAYEDRHRPPRGLVITKDVDFNLSWQDDSRVRIHEISVPDSRSGGNGTVDTDAGTAVELDVIVRQANVAKETKINVAGDGSVAVEQAESELQIPPTAMGVTLGVRSVATPMPPV
ncbi:hypothetical protein MMC07_000055 [Pseudocyphellaria aurata]|nr:hypothetical protein [Pseudocyphellaria aurata]